jgi:hypothetical protein
MDRMADLGSKKTVRLRRMLGVMIWLALAGELLHVGMSALLP